MTTPQLTIKDILQKTTQFFREKGISSARLDTELLISAALKWERMKLYLNYEYPLSPEELTLCRDHVRRRSAGEPVAYILGKKDFYNHCFNVSSSVLIPRPETEQIVEETLEFLRPPLARVDAGDEIEVLAEDTRGTAFRIVDLGTGSGCIGLSLLAELPEARLLAVDVSSDAVAVARTNAELLIVSERVTWHVADAKTVDTEFALKTFGALADAVVANPPYIASDDPLVEKNVKLFEPSQALFAADRGLACIREWAASAAGLLRDGGLVIFEIGHDQGLAAKEIFEHTQQFVNIVIKKDLAGLDRIVRATRAARS